MDNIKTIYDQGFSLFCNYIEEYEITKTNGDVYIYFFTCQKKSELKNGCCSKHNFKQDLDEYKIYKQYCTDFINILLKKSKKHKMYIVDIFNFLGKNLLFLYSSKFDLYNEIIQKINFFITSDKTLLNDKIKYYDWNKLLDAILLKNL